MNALYYHGYRALKFGTSQCRGIRLSKRTVIVIKRKTLQLLLKRICVTYEELGNDC